MSSYMGMPTYVEDYDETTGTVDQDNRQVASTKESKGHRDSRKPRISFSGAQYPGAGAFQNYPGDHFMPDTVEQWAPQATMGGHLPDFEEGLPPVPLPAPRWEVWTTAQENHLKESKRNGKSYPEIRRSMWISFGIDRSINVLSKRYRMMLERDAKDNVITKLLNGALPNLMQCLEDEMNRVDPKLIDEELRRDVYAKLRRTFPKSELLKDAETYEQSQPRSDEPKREAEFLSDEQIQQQEDEIRGPLVVPTGSHTQTWAGFDVQGYEPRSRSMENAEFDWENLGAQFRNNKMDVLTPDAITYSTTPNSEAGEPDDDEAVLHPKASEPSLETSFLDTEEDTIKRPVTGRGNRWLTGLKDLDAQEEECFNTSDDELDDLGKEIRASVNVASPLSKLLVDDPSHEENEKMETDLSGGILEGADKNKPPSSGTAIPSSPPHGFQLFENDWEGHRTAVDSFRDWVARALARETSSENKTKLLKSLESQVATAIQGQVAKTLGDRSKLSEYTRENDLQGLFTPSYLPLLDRPSRNERGSSTTEDERETGLLIDDEHLLPAPFSPSLEAENQPRRKRQPSPTPSMESLQSLVDSIFSHGSLSSASTAPGSDNAFQRVLAVLQTDAELKDLYVELTARTSALKCKRSLGILLKRFAVDLENESSCYDEQRTAKFIRSRARKIARRIVDAVYPSGSTIDRDQTSTSLTQTRAESSEDSRTDEEPDEYLELERFVTNSRSFKNLRDNIRVFLGLELSKLLAELPFVDENRLAKSEESINSGQNALSCGKSVWSKQNFHHKIRDFLFPEPPIPSGLTRVRWKCPCGEILYDDYEELKPGAAKRMEDYLRRFSYKGCAEETKSLSERISNVWSSFRGITTLVTQWTGTLKNNGKTTIVHTELRYYSDARTTRTPAHASGEVFYLLLCHNSGVGAEVVKLRQPDICDINNDQKLFSFLHEEYLTLRKRWWTWISLWTLQSIKFVRFELYENELVDVKKLDDVPPPTKDNEYRHGPPNPPELNPPLGSTLLMHLFKHPELAGTRKKCLQKIPRKLRNRLAVLDADDDAIGWGLQFIEGWSKKRLMYMTALTFGFSSVVVMVLVSILGHDVQNAGAIASFILSFVTIGIATAQAAMHMN